MFILELQEKYKKKYEWGKKEETMLNRHAIRSLKK